MLKKILNTVIDFIKNIAKSLHLKELFNKYKIHLIVICCIITCGLVLIFFMRRPKKKKKRITLAQRVDRIKKKKVRKLRNDMIKKGSIFVVKKMLKVG